VITSKRRTQVGHESKPLLAEAPLASARYWQGWNRKAHETSHLTIPPTCFFRKQFCCGSIPRATSSPYSRNQHHQHHQTYSPLCISGGLSVELFTYRKGTSNHQSPQDIRKLGICQGDIPSVTGNLPFTMTNIGVSTARVQVIPHFWVFGSQLVAGRYSSSLDLHTHKKIWVQAKV